MCSDSKFKSLILLIGAAVMLGSTANAWAAGTPAGTTIESQARAIYSDVNGNERGEVSSNVVSFVVGKRSSVSLTAITTQVDIRKDITAGQYAWFAFEVENMGNHDDILYLHIGELRPGDSYSEDEMVIFKDSGTTEGVYDEGDVEWNSDKDDVNVDVMSSHLSIQVGDDAGEVAAVYTQNLASYYYFKDENNNINNMSNQILPNDDGNFKATVISLDMDEKEKFLVGLRPGRSSQVGREFEVKVFVSSGQAYAKMLFDGIADNYAGGSGPADGVVDYGTFTAAVNVALEPKLSLRSFNSSGYSDLDVIPGETLVYRLEIRNIGEGPAHDVLLFSEIEEDLVSFVDGSLVYRRFDPNDVGTYYNYPLPTAGAEAIDINSDHSDFITENSFEQYYGYFLGTSLPESDGLVFKSDGSTAFLNLPYSHSGTGIAVHLPELLPASIGDPSRTHGFAIQYQVKVKEDVIAGTILKTSPTIYSSSASGDAYPTQSFDRLMEFPITAAALDNFPYSAFDRRADVRVGLRTWFELAPIRAFREGTDRNSSDYPNMVYQGENLTIQGNPGDFVYFEVEYENRSNNSPGQLWHNDFYVSTWFTSPEMSPWVWDTSIQPDDQPGLVAFLDDDPGLPLSDLKFLGSSGTNQGHPYFEVFPGLGTRKTILMRVKIPKSVQDGGRVTLKANQTTYPMFVSSSNGSQIGYPDDPYYTTELRNDKTRLEALSDLYVDVYSIAPNIAITKSVHTLAQFNSDSDLFDADDQWNGDWGDNNPKVTPGEFLVYVIRVQNNGEGDATQVTITDAIPNEVSYTSAGYARGLYLSETDRRAPKHPVTQDIRPEIPSYANPSGSGIYTDLGMYPEIATDALPWSGIAEEQGSDGPGGSLKITLPKIYGYHSWQVHYYVKLKDLPQNN